MGFFHSKFLWAALLSSTAVFTVVSAEQVTEIRNKHRSMASGEATVFATSEGQTATNSPFRGGLGVNFPSGSAVRLLVAQRTTMQRIQTGDKVTTTAASSSSGGWNSAPAVSDSNTNSLRFTNESCTASPFGLTYAINASAKLDSESINVQDVTTPYFVEYRSTPVYSSLPSAMWTSVANESSTLSCMGSTLPLPISCWFQGRIKYLNGSNTKDVVVVGRKCTCTAVGSCTWEDFTL